MKEKNLTIPVMRFGSKPEQNMKSWLMEQAATSMRKPEKYVSLKGDERLGKLINELHSGLKGDSVKLTKRPLVQQSASTRPVKMGPKPTSNGDNTFKVKGLHKPVIKTEPMDETPQIKEYDSQPSPVVGDEKENTEENFEGTCLTKDQKDSFKFDGRLIQLTEIQIEALGKSLYEKAIGEGAFGQVYSSKLFGIPVAVKKIQTNTSPQNEKHARMEMMANRLMNPFILPLIAFAKKSNGICRETWYITPYCENGDLKKAIEDGKARKDKKINLPGIRVRIALQVALAIQYIHTEVPNVRGSILHKDIASSNVVLDKNLNARLIDFGLAREKNDTSNTNSERPGYIHPLEGHGDPVKESLDYYNFGIIILELLTSLGPLGEKQLHLKNMDENQIQNKLDTNVWIDKEITKKLYALSKKCLEEFKWTIEEFETNVIKALQDIMRTEAVDIHVYECQEETCHHCIINPIAKQSSLTDDHYANCTQKIKVCIACEKNSILNPVICYCGARLISMIGSKWGALLVAGDDESPDKAAVMKREILELERVVTSKAPRIIGISKCNVKTVVPCDTKKETKKEETWTKIQKHIADFAKNEDIDTLLIYISCHGDNGKDKESSERNMFRLGKSSEYISLVAFEEQLETLNKIDKLIIFLDRCFPPMVEFKDRNRDFVQINACSEGEKAILKDEGSLFTTYVIQGLKARSEKRECSKDCEHCFSYWNKRTEYISIDSLFDYVNKHLKQKAPTSKRHLKGTLYDIAFFTEEMVHIEFTSKDKTIRLQLEYLKNIDEVKGMLLKEFEVDTETHMVKIEKDIFRNDQEADDECKTLEQVMEAWVNRFPLLVSFLKKKDT
ncbi:uncharacterized protein LOC132757385 [Ruditapes philippinarum]|uniref:uncharacterized protein LOC132757385 n=1 Tax=Ruditapes philippinarum TaxID=129788 RepID=UPI00295A7DC9|nr:uncharacterized protein LOC132757385 [Ruditapes philippinarum]